MPFEAFIDTNNSSVSPEGTTMFAMIRTMISFFRLFGFTLQHEVQTQFPNANPSALHRWECLQQNFFDFSKASTDDIQPILVFSNITPNNTSQFLYHLLLSMGEYDTEMDLLTHVSMRDSFVCAKLVDANDLVESVNRLTKRYILEQLCFYPIGTKRFDFFMEMASTTLTEVIVHDRMPIFEMPACLYTVLQQSMSVKAEKRIKHMRETALVVAYRELESVSIHQSSFPSLEEFMEGNMGWDGME
jgi:hypothetical protein